MLEVRDLTVKYGEFAALRDVSFNVADGEIVVLLGANGAGKSTLFRTLAGLQKPTTGRATYNGEDLSAARPERAVRHGVALCPEGRLLFPELSVQKNLLLGGYVHKSDRAGQKRLLQDVYELFPILHEKRDDPAGSLSGGQQQMVAIGRALMAKPTMLMLDEPSLGLAPLVVEQVLEAVQKINRAGTSVLLAEQNAYAALQVANRGYVIENGRITLEGSQSALLGDDRIRAAYIGV